MIAQRSLYILCKSSLRYRPETHAGDTHRGRPNQLAFLDLSAGVSVGRFADALVEMVEDVLDVELSDALDDMPDTSDIFIFSNSLASNTGLFRDR